MHPVLQAVMGVLVFAALAFACSRSRQVVRWRFVGLAVATQFAVAALFLHVGVAKALLSGLTQVAKLLEDSTRQATSFVFGYVGGAEAPFEIGAGASTFVFAFQVLPIIIVVGALSALLWHWRVLNAVIAPVAWIVRRTLGVSGPVGFVAVANAFLSMLEGPMLIKPYLSRLKEHELFAVMTVGLSTVAGGTLIVISSILAVDEQAFGHVVTATLMNVFGAIAVSHLMFPGDSADPADRVVVTTPHRSSMDALVAGTADGGRVFLNVVALLIVFMSLMALINSGLGLLHSGLSLEQVLAWPAAPFVWLMGMPLEEVLHAGGILGTKVAINEIVAYSLLAESYSSLSAPTAFTLTFALCGFGNIGSLGILIGGLTAMAPERRADILRWSPLALWAALLANGLTASIAFIVSGHY